MSKMYVMPAKAGIHALQQVRFLVWIPAFAGMTLLAACSPSDMMRDAMKDGPQRPIENKVGPNGELISPDCPNWKAPSTDTYANDRPANMGCATVTNLGLMLEDPRDLERGGSGGRVSPDPDRSADAIKNRREALSSPAAKAAAGASSTPASVSSQ